MLGQASDCAGRPHGRPEAHGPVVGTGSGVCVGSGIGVTVGYPGVARPNRQPMSGPSTLSQIDLSYSPFSRWPVQRGH